MDWLCSVLQWLIAVGIHAMNSLWTEHWDDMVLCVLLVDSSNVFNEINRTEILCRVQHIWRAGARFIFNTYWHWKVLALNRSELTVNYKEGVTHGDPLVMIMYGLGVLPLVWSIQHHVLHLDWHHHCDTLQFWYADYFTIT